MLRNLGIESNQINKSVNMLLIDEVAYSKTGVDAST
jgi:hypothetical protein